LEFFQQTIAANPQTFALIADLWAKNLDVQFMPQIAERFKTLVPPQVLAKEEGKQLPPQPPNPQQQMMQQEMQMQQAKIQQAQADIQIKAAKLKIEQEQNEIDKAELMIKAQEIQNKNQLDIYNHQSDLERSRITHGMNHQKMNNDFSVDIAKIMADLHKKND